MRCEVKTPEEIKEIAYKIGYILEKRGLANAITGGHKEPDNKSLFRIIPLRFHRR